MLNWILAAILLVLAALVVARRTRAKRRVSRRHVRRARNIAYERLWNRIMVRPRTKRLTLRPRKDAAETEPTTRSS